MTSFFFIGTIKSLNSISLSSSCSKINNIKLQKRKFVILNPCFPLCNFQFKGSSTHKLRSLSPTSFNSTVCLDINLSIKLSFWNFFYLTYLCICPLKAINFIHLIFFFIFNNKLKCLNVLGKLELC